MCASRCKARPTRRSGAVVHLKTGDYPGLVEAIEAAIPELGGRPRSVIACGAGPVDGRKLKLTNAPWLIDGPEAARRLGLGQGLLFNDFEAQALSLPAIPREWARAIGPAPFGARGPAGHPRARHGPRHRRPDRSGRTPYAARLGGVPHRLRPGRRRGGRAVAASRARAWPRDHRKRHLRSRPRSRARRAHGGARAAEAVARRAGAGRRRRSPNRDGEEAASLRLFWRIVARFAGDMGVAFVATGGVTLAGGVLPRIVDFLDDAAFRRAFEAKAPVDALARRIPTRLVMRADSVLVGMAAIAAAPQLYAIDTRARGWV